MEVMDEYRITDLMNLLKATDDFLRTSIAVSYRCTKTPISPEVESFFKQSDVEGEVGLLTCVDLWIHLCDKEWSDLNLDGYTHCMMKTISGGLMTSRNSSSIV